MSPACSATLWLTPWTNESSHFLLHLPRQYMETLPVKTLDELFSNPATCLAVFRFPPYPPSPPPPPPLPPPYSPHSMLFLFSLRLASQHFAPKFSDPCPSLPRCSFSGFSTSTQTKWKSRWPSLPPLGVFPLPKSNPPFPFLMLSCHFSFQPRSPLTVPWISPSRRCRPSRSAILPQGISNSTLPSGKTSRMP